MISFVVIAPQKMKEKLWNVKNISAPTTHYVMIIFFFKDKLKQGSEIAYCKMCIVFFKVVCTKTQIRANNISFSWLQKLCFFSGGSKTPNTGIPSGKDLCKFCCTALFLYKVAQKSGEVGEVGSSSENSGVAGSSSALCNV